MSINAPLRSSSPIVVYGSQDDDLRRSIASSTDSSGSSSGSSSVDSSSPRSSEDGSESPKGNLVIKDNHFSGSRSRSNSTDSTSSTDSTASVDSVDSVEDIARDARVVSVTVEPVNLKDEWNALHQTLRNHKSYASTAIKLATFVCCVAAALAIGGAVASLATHSFQAKLVLAGGIILVVSGVALSLLKGKENDIDERISDLENALSEEENPSFFNEINAKFRAQAKSKEQQDLIAEQADDGPEGLELSNTVRSDQSAEQAKKEAEGNAWQARVLALDKGTATWGKFKVAAMVVELAAFLCTVGLAVTGGVHALSNHSLVVTDLTYAGITTGVLGGGEVARRLFEKKQKSYILQSRKLIQDRQNGL